MENIGQYMDLIPCVAAMHHYVDRKSIELSRFNPLEDLCLTERRLEKEACRMSIELLESMSKPELVYAYDALERQWVFHCSEYDYPKLTDGEDPFLWDFVYNTLLYKSDRVIHTEKHWHGSLTHSVAAKIQSVLQCDDPMQPPCDVPLDVMLDSTMNAVMESQLGLDTVVSVAEMLDVCARTSSDRVFESHMQTSVWIPMLQMQHVDIVKGYTFVARHHRQFVLDASVRLAILRGKAERMSEQFKRTISIINAKLQAVSGRIFKYLDVEPTYSNETLFSSSTVSVVLIDQLCKERGWEWYKGKKTGMTPQTQSMVAEKICAKISAPHLSISDAKKELRPLMRIVGDIRTLLRSTKDGKLRISNFGDSEKNVEDIVNIIEYALLKQPSTRSIIKNHFLPWLEDFCGLLDRVMTNPLA
jgi:hypothetical protein